MRVRPTYAVMPGMPSAPRYADAGTRGRVDRADLAGGQQRVGAPAGLVEDGVAGLRSRSAPEATTSPTAPPSIGASSANGGT